VECSGILSRRSSSTVTIGVLAATPGVAIGLFLDRNSPPGSRWVFATAAGASAFVTMMFLWWMLVARRESFTIARGALAGALAGAVSHYPCWYIFLSLHLLCDKLALSCRDAGGAPASAIESFGAAAKMSIFSLIFLGWLTMGLGALLGALVARANRAHSIDVKSR